MQNLLRAACLLGLGFLHGHGSQGIQFYDRLDEVMQECPPVKAQSPRISLSRSSEAAEPEAQKPVFEIKIEKEYAPFNYKPEEIAGKKLQVTVDLKVTMCEDLPLYVMKIRQLASERDPGFIEHVFLRNGTSRKLNLIFPCLYQLLRQEKLHYLTYQARPDATQAVAARDAVAKAQAEGAGILDVQEKGNGVAGFTISSPQKAQEERYLSPNDYAKAVFETVEKLENQYLQKYFNDPEIKDVLPVYAHQVVERIMLSPKEHEEDNLTPSQWLAQKMEELGKTEIRAVVFRGVEIDSKEISGLIKLFKEMPNLKILDLRHIELAPLTKRQITALLDSPLVFIDISYTAYLSQSLFMEGGLWDSLKKMQREGDIARFIWTVSDAYAIGKAKMPEECRRYCLPSHVKYGKVREVLSEAHTRLRIHSSINGWVKKLARDEKC